MKSLNALIINGSPSLPSRTVALAAYVEKALGTRGMATSTLSLRDLPAEALVGCQVDDPRLREAVEAVAAAKIIVLATPIYKAAYSGLLKLFLDLLPQFAFSDKLVLPLGTAGSPANVLALDYALRPVLASLGVRHVGTSFVALDQHVDGNGQLAAEAAQRLEPILDSFADDVRRYA